MHTVNKVDHYLLIFRIYDVQDTKSLQIVVCVRACMSERVCVWTFPGILLFNNPI